MSDLIERLRERADEMEFATNLEAEAAAQLEAQQAEIAQLRGALERCLNFIENTEGEMGEELPCGDIAREALEQKP